MNEIINKKIKKGFTLLETIIAISFLSIGTFVTFGLIVNTKENMSFTSSKLQASYLAQEGIEIIRNIRDTNWIEGNDWNEGLTDCSSNTDGCFVDHNTPATTTPTLEPYNGQFLTLLDETSTKFQRKITINASTTNSDDDDILEVRVDVFWKEKGRGFSFTIKENLYNWMKNNE